MGEQPNGNWPCRIEGVEVIPCHGLEACLEEANSRKKGVSMILVSNIHTGDVTKTGVVLRSGDHAKKGIIMNFCPFCGEDISSVITGRNPREEVEAS